YADLLAEHADQSQTAEDRREYIDTIKRNGEYLLAIINDILDLSKIEAGKMNVESIRVDPRRLLLDVESLMNVKARLRGISLRFVQDTALPETIHSDPVRLRQILVNLLGNAIKFTNAGGVTIHASLDERNPAEPLLRVSVVDTGIGMSRDQVSKLFMAFEQ